MLPTYPQENTWRVTLRGSLKPRWLECSRCHLGMRQHIPVHWDCLLVEDWAVEVSGVVCKDTAAGLQTPKIFLEPDHRCPGLHQTQAPSPFQLHHHPLSKYGGKCVTLAANSFVFSLSQLHQHVIKTDLIANCKKMVDYISLLNIFVTLRHQMLHLVTCKLSTTIVKDIYCWFICTVDICRSTYHFI